MALLAAGGLSLPSMKPAGAQAIDKAEGTVRVASFNASLSRQEPGTLLDELRQGGHQQIRNVAETIRRVQPDILLINEFDRDTAGEGPIWFAERYLRDPGIDAPVSPLGALFSGPSNTGLQSGLDLDGDGRTGGPGDAFGYGSFEGQYAMALFSRWAFANDRQLRTFQNFLWRDLPQARLPDKVTGSGLGDFYSPKARAALRLSSKSHWDIPIALPGGKTLHVLASHPTPPVFDGPENRNGRRNADEIRFWNTYIGGGAPAGALSDDDGRTGGLPRGASFVILGDLNNDPLKGDGDRSAIPALTSLERVQDPQPASAAGGTDTAHFRNGRLRVDYVLPSSDLTAGPSGVFWPGPGDDGHHLIGGDGRATSDHRLVWVDLLLG